MNTKSMISYQGNVTLKIYHGDKEVTYTLEKI